jgi:hypothetical protein
MFNKIVYIIKIKANIDIPIKPIMNTSKNTKHKYKNNIIKENIMSVNVIAISLIIINQWV